ncbi:hypothetical protein [Jannaschia rubra]|uniref:Uncharacterized protein n=1 Tax=Jannaschia rubra TaxID=282197 RepID=A0A0M6XUM8_9RHOB|nr:hypothetical protein [Jannaschia rubra]CTQ34810.1 hypothetical protein JAN5088_03606 [Jannaschia rubra]SFG67554.1 hypothetical protein SAMN04488517_11061 [Jannaschia rubra]
MNTGSFIIRGRPGLLTIVIAPIACVILSFTTPVAARALDCDLYHGSDPVRHPIAIYETAPMLGGVADVEELIFDPRYGFEGRPPPAFDPPQSSVLFEIDIATGLPRLDRSQQSIQGGEYMTLLVLGNAPGALATSLTAIVGAPVSEPLAPPSFRTTGESLAGYELVSVARQDDSAVERLQVGVDRAEDGRITSILSCDRRGVVPNPTCSVREEADRLQLKTTFLRDHLDEMDRIRNRAADFAACLFEH